MLGHDLVATAPREVEVIALTRAQVDITDRHALEEEITGTGPTVIINSAAYTAVDRAEAERETAFRVNAEAVRSVGTVARRVGAKVVHFSTDYVFDGTASQPYSEDALAKPINVYGASKLAGEEALAGSGCRFLILRTQWLFGAHGPCFPRTMLELAQRRIPTQVVQDQIGRPTYTRDLAQGVWTLVHSGREGLLHIANSGQASWFDVATEVFAFVGVRELVAPCASNEYPAPARRPQFSVLNTERAKTLLGAPLPHWRHALENFLRQL
jgi:dTDP-4-dehydrorhamnose reductase